MSIDRLDNLYNSVLTGDLNSLREFLDELTAYIPPGIDNMVFLLEREQYSLYLSRDGLKSVMVARGEFLPFIESHVARMSIDRLKEEELHAIRERLREILLEIKRNISKHLELLEPESREYIRLKQFVEWIEGRLGQSTS